jgi:cell division transport system permease protein
MELAKGADVLALGLAARFRRGNDNLGLRQALSNRLLPALVAAMAFLAALAAAGAVAASSLAAHWQQGAGAAVTIQIPHPGDAAADGTRLDTALAILRAAPGFRRVEPLSEGAMNDLLRPWLGADAESLSLPLPAVITVHLADPRTDLETAAAALTAAVPGALVERHEVWTERLALLARSLQACAAAALLLVSAVGVAVIAVATRSGLSARRESIEIVHMLGATDSYIAGRFAERASVLAAIGGVIGAAAVLPVLLGLASLAAPFGASSAALATASPPAAGLALPGTLWLTLAGLPLVAAGIGWLTAQGTVRSWLRQLP